MEVYIIYKKHVFMKSVRPSVTNGICAALVEVCLSERKSVTKKGWT